MDVTAILNGLEQVSVVTWIICIIVCALVLRVYSSDRANSPPLPPSPRFWLPIFGHLLQVNKDLRVTFCKFRKRFGDVYGFYMGTRYTVVISGYETLTEAFKTRSLFIDRPDMLLFDLCLRKKGIASANGEVWREHRRFAISTLKEFGLGRSAIIEKRINAETKLFLDAMSKEEGKPFDPIEMIETASSNIICSMTFGATFKYGDPKFKTLAETFAIVNRAIASSGVGNAMPFLAKLPGDILNTKEISRDADARFAFMREIIDEHLKNYDENVIDDFTSAFIKTMRQKQLKNEPTTFTVDQLSGVISDLFIAGSETTAATLRWVLACLISFPETQTRLYDVIKKHVGTERLPALEDRAALSYIEAFYMEILRYCKVTLTSFIYMASNDVELNGYRIPKDAIILPDISSVASDPHIWGDPETFRPDRFLNEDGSIRTQEEFIPFFMGKRRCLGESMARMELFLFIGAMVQNYIFESPDGEEVSMRVVDGIFEGVHKPKPFRIVARARHTQ